MRKWMVLGILLLTGGAARAQTTVTLPAAAPAVGAKAGSYTDPLTGKRVYRLSDRNFCPFGALHFYSYTNQFSPQGRTVFLCKSDPGNANVDTFPVYDKDFTLLAKNAVTAAGYVNAYGNPLSVAWPQWSQSREVLFAIAGGKVVELDPFNGTNRVAADFLGNLPNVRLPSGATVSLGAIRDMKVGPGDRLVVEMQCMAGPANPNCPGNYAVVAVGDFDPQTGRYSAHAVYGTANGVFDEGNITQNPFGRVHETFGNKPQWTYHPDFSGPIRLDDGHGHMGFFSGTDGRHYVVKVKNDLLSNGGYGQIGCSNSGFSYWKPEFGLYDDETGQRALIWGCDIPGANTGRDHFSRSIGARDVFGGSDWDMMLRFALSYDSAGKLLRVTAANVAHPRSNAACGYWATPRVALDHSGNRFLFDSTASHATHVSLENGALKTSCTTDVYVAEFAASAPAPVLTVSPASVSFSAVQGGGNPAAESVSVSNTGGGALNWTATASTPWLTVSPAAGSNAGTVTLAVNSGGLSAGTYSGTVTFAAAGAQGSPAAVGMTLTVTPPTITVGALSVSPNPVLGGAGTTGTVTLSSAPAGGKSVALSSNSGTALVPASVVVPAGSASASFAIGTTAVTQQKQATISATLNGSVQAVLIVNPAPADTVKPTISITGTSVASNCNLTVNFVTTDNVAAVKVEAWLSGTLMRIVDPRDGSKATFSVAAYSRRLVTLQLKSYDAAGNQGAASKRLKTPTMRTINGVCQVVS